jgi:hypothetical protein
MDLIIHALAPVFVVALAIQMLIETLDPIFDKVFDRAVSDKKVKTESLPPSVQKDQMLNDVIAQKKQMKGFWLRAFSIAIGLGFSICLELRVLGPLGLSKIPQWIDIFVTGLCISNGTEGLNSVLKFISALKDSKTTDK